MILIAEDNPMMRKMIRSLVENLGHEILECSDGAAAFSLYERYRPDWVLMDVSMRPVDGLAATREIIGRFPEARVVIVTEHNDQATRAKAFEVGACEFIGKDELLPLPSLIAGVTSTAVKRLDDSE